MIETIRVGQTRNLLRASSSPLEIWSRAAHHHPGQRRQSAARTGLTKDRTRSPVHMIRNPCKPSGIHKRKLDVRPIPIRQLSAIFSCLSYPCRDRRPRARRPHALGLPPARRPQVGAFARRPRRMVSATATGKTAPWGSCSRAPRAGASSSRQLPTLPSTASPLPKPSRPSAAAPSWIPDSEVLTTARPRAHPRHPGRG
jgi:hypothetical protein